MKKLLVILLLAVSCWGVAKTSQAISLVNGLGGTAGYGENQLADNDDGSTALLDLSAVFAGGLNFYGTNYAGLYLNNNGNVTFGSSMGTYTPYSLSADTGTPIIAPWFADVDTRYTGELYYDFDTDNGTFTATWDAVGGYGLGTNLTNSFQLILTDQGSGDFDIEFRYASLGWTLGSASGNAHARAGYNSGNGTDYFELAESGDAELMLDLVNRSNVDEDGLFQWQVRNGTVIPPVDAPVPEPSTLLLLAGGLSGLVWHGRKRKKV